MAQRGARVPDHGVGFLVIRIQRQHFLRHEHLFCRLFLAGRGKFHGHAGHPHADHLLGKAAEGFVFLDFNRAQKAAPLEKERLVLQRGLQQADRVIVIF